MGPILDTVAKFDKERQSYSFKTYEGALDLSANDVFASMRQDQAEALKQLETSVKKAKKKAFYIDEEGGSQARMEQRGPHEEQKRVHNEA